MSEPIENFTLGDFEQNIFQKIYLAVEGEKETERAREREREREREIEIEREKGE